MFDRFTTASRKVMKAARSEAKGSDYISTRHLLLGLSLEDPMTKLVLDAVGLTTAILRAESKKHDVNKKGLDSGIIPFSSHARKVIEKAVEVAAARKSNCITPKHLFIGLSEIRGTSARTIARSAITPENLNKAMKKIVPGQADHRQDQVGKRVTLPTPQEPEKYQSPFTGEWM